MYAVVTLDLNTDCVEEVVAFDGIEEAREFAHKDAYGYAESTEDVYVELKGSRLIAINDTTAYPCYAWEVVQVSNK